MENTSRRRVFSTFLECSQMSGGCMSLSTCLEYGRHVARLRRRRRAYAPTSNTASHDNHEKIHSWSHSWVSFSFLYEYGAPLGGPLGRRSSAIIIRRTRDFSAGLLAPGEGQKSGNFRICIIQQKMTSHPV